MWDPRWLRVLVSLFAKPLANAAAQMAEGSVAKGATLLLMPRKLRPVPWLRKQAGKAFLNHWFYGETWRRVRPRRCSRHAGAAIPVVGAGVGALARAAKVAGKGAMKVALGFGKKKSRNMKNYEKLQTLASKKEIEAALSDNLATIKKVSQDKQVKLTDDILR